MSRRHVLFAAILFAWFWYFCHDALTAHFAPDDLMNLDFYWHMKPVQLVTSHALVWHNFYRPMGAVFYLPLYAAFGLDPKPYHLVILIVLMANAWLVYRLATLLRAGPLAAGLAALVSCYHAGLSNLTYNTAFIYDVLCGFFYLAALVYYLHIREAGRHLRAREIAAFLGLYLCALNSKEMAVTLPVVLLIYEWTHHGQAALRVPFLAGLINLPYVYGKALRGDALASMDGYRMEFTWARIADFQLRSFRDLMAGYEVAAATIVWIYVALIYLAWRRPRPVLRFCALFVLIAPLPIEFLPGRGSACLYLPFVGWTIFLSVVAIDVAGAAATFLAGEPGFRRLGKQALFGMLLAGCVTLWGS